MSLSLQQQLSKLDPQMREYFEERAAILEFDCKLSRSKAEFLAWMETSAETEKSKKTLAQRIAAMAQHQAQQPQHLHISKRVDSAQLAAGVEA